MSEGIQFDKTASLRQVIRLAIPVIVSMSSMAVMGLVDTFFMGMLGSTAQAAVGLGAPLIFSVLSLFLGTWAGLTTFVAQCYGAKEYLKGSQMMWHVFLLAIVCIGIVELCVVPAIPWIFGIAGANPDIIPDALDYTNVRLHGAIFVFSAFILTAFLRGIGDMRTTAIVTCVGVAFNALVTYLFAFGAGPVPAMGVTGAALGTVVAEALETLLYALVVFGRKNNALLETRKIPRFRMAEFAKFLKIGFPVGMSWMLENVGWIIFTLYAGTLSKEAMSAHTIVFQLMNIAFTPGLAISIAATTLVGHYIGADDVPNAERSAKLSIRMAGVLMIAVGLLLMIFRVPITSCFTNETAVAELAYPLFYFGAVYQLFDALGVVSSGAIRGAGDTRWPMVASLLVIWVGMVPSIYVVGFVYDLGLNAAWVVCTATIIVQGIFYYARFRRGKWKKMRVI